MKCAICEAPADAGFWHAWLCFPCYAAWNEQAPRTTPIELAHAKAHPEDVELEGDYQWRDAAREARGDGQHWVVLKPEVSTAIARAAALAWFEERKKNLTRRSA